ncbi:hypothetical protein ACIBO5_11045 [Nonomuraea angiospora]|uniref:hypothetical protein n=1 Tax=Nonomuraea angiospora TaxID=46172 RepID=UPI0037AB5E32
MDRPAPRWRVVGPPGASRRGSWVRPTGLDHAGARRAIEAVLETPVECIAPGEVEELGECGLSACP